MSNAIQTIFQKHISTHEFEGLPRQYKVSKCICNCKTSALGGVKVTCNDCGAERYIYKSCGNRHCPTCNSLKQLCWQEARESEYINTDYYHAVFTVPDCLNSVFLRHQTECYNLLFGSVSDTLNTLAADPKRLNARIGFICVLHTWGSTLSFHPHIHVLLMGCGLNHINKLVFPKGKFLFPVKVMSALFRGKFLDGLRKLGFDDTIDYASLYERQWVVYIKESIPGSKHVIEYLARYIYKTAISDSRIISCNENSVSFRYKDYRDDAKIKVMSLTSDEFIRRFLLHVLPKGFIRVRFYGLLSNRNKNDSLTLIRRLLSIPAPTNRFKNKTAIEILKILYGDRYCTCKKCGSQNLSSSIVPPLSPH